MLLRKSGAESIKEAVASSKENTIYYSIASHKLDIIEITPDNKSNSLKNLNSNAKDFNPTFAHNSNDIYFVSNRTGYREIWFFDKEKNSTKQISHIEASLMLSPVISNDNQFIAVVYRKKALKLSILNAKTGAIISSQPLEQGLAPLSWSLDNKYLYLDEHSAKNPTIKTRPQYAKI